MLCWCSTVHAMLVVVLYGSSREWSLLLWSVKSHDVDISVFGLPAILTSKSFPHANSTARLVVLLTGKVYHSPMEISGNSRRNFWSNGNKGEKWEGGEKWDYSLSFLVRIIHSLGRTFFLWKIQDGGRTFYRIQGKKVRLKYSATHLMELNSTLQKCNIWTDLSLRKFALEFSLHSARDLSQFLNSENFK